MTFSLNEQDLKFNGRRRKFAKQIVLATGAVAAGSVVNEASASTSVGIKRFVQAAPFPVNAYIVEGPDAVVVVDSTLKNSASKALKQQVDDIGKPLNGVLLTHPHPDHYAGLHNLVGDTDTPIISVEGVNKIVRRDDAAKNDLIGGMFGDEWPSKRLFPNQQVKEGDTIDLGEGLRFDVLDIGPAESFHDSVFLHHGENPTAFVGDLAYALMHPYMADNNNAQWIAGIDRLQSDLAENTVMYVGHGLPVTPSFLAWQKTYLDKFEMSILKADWSNKETAVATVSAEMQNYLPNESLMFLMQLSIEPNAHRLGLLK